MGFYRPRHPQSTALYRLFTSHYDSLQQGYARFEERYGFFRPEIERERQKYQKCGLPERGFARLRCQTEGCGHGLLLAFSCKSRSLCPSCMQKHMLERAEFLLDNVVRVAPHRHFVFVIPKLLRKNFYWHRESLNDLSRLAWSVLAEFQRRTLKIKGAPAAILAIETSGEYQDLNPHVHAVAADGLLDARGVFHWMPHYDETGRRALKILWQDAVLRYCLGKGYVRPETAARILSQEHTGFSVYTGRRIHYSPRDPVSREELAQLLRYIHKPHVALSKIEFDERAGRVIYRGDYHPSRGRNYEVFTPEEFLAAVTSHVPNYRQKYVNAYGLYSNKSRGVAAKSGEATANATDPQPAPEEQKAYRKTWAMLIRQVWEVDPLVCPKCGGEMKVVAIVLDRQDIAREVRELRTSDAERDAAGTDPPLAVPA